MVLSQNGYETARVLLYSPEQNDIDDFLESFNKSKKHLSPWLKWANNDINKSNATTIINSYKEKILARREFRFFLRLKLSKKFIGSVTLRNIEWREKTAEIGYWLDVDYLNKGYMYEVTSFLLDYAHNELGLLTVNAITYADNKSSIKLLQKLEFEFKQSITEESKEISIYYKNL
ncbi:GNAT family N-acetyltransferase [Cytobacillus kochii]|uniref:GNAT family N-acetyltransferase n=1 Tax=Cytobacillus kochii TaxID=859143 RepID=UPI00204154CF|nr:GNAT family N-acetyltransferase [Cytobacillus kochii]MCM3324760.1 GNAT family N-acetyltransferase [Cytobacillus kochii]MCM3347153.1 GNAT family N-acetyltransferase [Cytobacillus kochii]